MTVNTLINYLNAIQKPDKMKVHIYSKKDQGFIEIQWNHLQHKDDALWITDEKIPFALSYKREKK